MFIQDPGHTDINSIGYKTHRGSALTNRHWAMNCRYFRRERFSVKRIKIYFAKVRDKRLVHRFKTSFGVLGKRK